MPGPMRPRVRENSRRRSTLPPLTPGVGNVGRFFFAPEPLGIGVPHPRACREIQRISNTELDRRFISL